MNSPYLGDPSSKFFLELRSLIWRRRYLVFSIILTGTILSFLHAHRQTPMYTATASVVIEPSWVKVPENSTLISEPATDNATLETQLSVIKSPSHAELVVERMELTQDREFNPYLAQTHEKSISVDSQAAPIASWFPADWLIISGIASERGFKDSSPDAAQTRAMQATTAAFLGRLDVRRQGYSHVLEIEFTAGRPEKAIEIANKTAELYVYSKLADMRDAARQSSAWLAARLAALREELRESEEAVERYRAEHDLADRGSFDLLDQELASYLEALIDARAKLAHRESRLERIKSLKVARRPLEGVPEVIASPLYLQLWQRKAELLSERAEFDSVFGASHPQMQKVESDLHDIRRRISMEVERVLEVLEGEVEIAHQSVSMLEDKLREIKLSSLSDRQASVRLRELERQALANRQLYQNLLARYKESEHQSEFAQPRVRVIARAQGARSNASDSRIFMVVGLLASSVVGVGLARVLDVLDRGIRTSRELEAASGVRCISMVPELKLSQLRNSRAPHRYALRNPPSIFTESVRLIISSVHSIPQTSQARLVQFSSSVPGEGKTTLAVSVAVVLAQAGAKTLLVDFDYRRPAVFKTIFGEDQSLYTSGEGSLLGLELSEFSELISDSETKLDVLTFRNRDASSDLLLVSERLEALIKFFRSSYDVVIIDGPPILGLADSERISAFVDAVFFVVRWGHTSNEEVLQSMKQIEFFREKISGSVLSRCDLKRISEYGSGRIDSYYTRYRKYYQDR